MFVCLYVSVCEREENYGCNYKENVNNPYALQYLIERNTSYLVRIQVTHGPQPFFSAIRGIYDPPLPLAQT